MYKLINNIFRIIQKFLLKTKKEPVLLFMDAPEHAGDNSEAMYRYYQNNDDYKIYFVLRKKSKDWKRLNNSFNLLNLNGFRYIFKYLIADVAFVSYSLYSPKGIKYFKGLTNFKYVWLQHGIIHTDLSNMYNSKCGHDLVTVGTKNEYKDRLRKEYGYKKNQIVLTGLARYDLLDKTVKPKKIICVSLTYRLWLRGKKFSEICKSTYYSMISNLLCNSDFVSLVESYGYKIQTILHSEVSHDFGDKLLPLFDARVKVLEDVPYKDIFHNTSLLITDYSSIAFDFAYLEKPVIYYQADADEFFSGKHTYTLSPNFSFNNDGFGDIVVDIDDLYNLVEQYLKNNCKMKTKYLTRTQETFAFHDQDNRHRIFKKVKNSFLYE